LPGSGHGPRAYLLKLRGQRPRDQGRLRVFLPCVGARRGCIRPIIPRRGPGRVVFRDLVLLTGRKLSLLRVLFRDFAPVFPPPALCDHGSRPALRFSRSKSPSTRPPWSWATCSNWPRASSTLTFISPFLYPPNSHLAAAAAFLSRRIRFNVRAVVRLLLPLLYGRPVKQKDNNTSPSPSPPVSPAPPFASTGQFAAPPRPPPCDAARQDFLLRLPYFSPTVNDVLGMEFFRLRGTGRL